MTCTLLQSFNDAVVDRVKALPAGANPDEIYFAVRGDAPECSGCFLPTIVAAKAAFDQTGVFPTPLDITKDQKRAAVDILSSHYAAREAKGDALPKYGRLYANHAAKPA